MKIPFSKYQGTGNDFVMIDNTTGAYDGLTLAAVQMMCDRKLGIGADGLIKLNKAEGFDFEMEYFNADGSKSFCGNGARCTVAFANSLGLVEKDAKFLAIDGVHKAKIKGNNVEIEMLPVDKIIQMDQDFFVNTGSPHFVRTVDPKNVPEIVAFGKQIRYSSQFEIEGVNVNTFYSDRPNSLCVETYERGVEDETLSCGTGVTACALVYLFQHEIHKGKVDIHTKGGDLQVSAERAENGGYDHIWLTGPAVKVFDGRIEI